MTWGRGQGLWGVAKAVRANPNLNPKFPKAVGSWPRPWGVAKAVKRLPRPWGRGHGRGGVAKILGVWPRP